MPVNILGFEFKTEIERLVDIVNGKLSYTPALEDLAVEILRYVQQERLANPASEALEERLNRDARRLWYSQCEPKYHGVEILCHLETVTQADGKRLVIVDNVERKSESFVSQVTPQVISQAIRQVTLQKPKPKKTIEEMDAEIAEVQKEIDRFDERKALEQIETPTIDSGTF